MTARQQVRLSDPIKEEKMNINETTGYVLYEENLFDGILSAEMYESEEEALEALNEIVNECDDEHIEVGDNYAMIGETVIVCKPLEDAVSPETKIVWSVRQNLFFETEHPFLFDWNYTYSSEAEAKVYLKEALEQYREQAEIDPSITIREGGSRTAYIYKNGELMVSLVCDSTAVGLTGDMNTINLNQI